MYPQFFRIRLCAVAVGVAPVMRHFSLASVSTRNGLHTITTSGPYPVAVLGCDPISWDAVLHRNYMKLGRLPNYVLTIILQIPKYFFGNLAENLSMTHNFLLESVRTSESKLCVCADADARKAYARLPARLDRTGWDRTLCILQNAFLFAKFGFDFFFFFLMALRQQPACDKSPPEQPPRTISSPRSRTDSISYGNVRIPVFVWRAFCRSRRELAHTFMLTCKRWSIQA